MQAQARAHGGSRLESQLRKSVHEIESTLKDYSGAGLNSAMLTMRRQ